MNSNKPENKKVKVLNTIEILVNGETHKRTKVPDTALDEFLHHVNAQMDECPHGSSWEDCLECEK